MLEKILHVLFACILFFLHKTIQIKKPKVSKKKKEEDSF